jgi:hypothetical protein
MNVLSAQRRRLVRLQKVGVLEPAVMQEIEVDLDLAEIALDRLEWRRAEPAGATALPKSQPRASPSARSRLYKA